LAVAEPSHEGRRSTASLTSPLFDADELDFLREPPPHLAAAAQRGLLVGEATDPDGPEAPGLVVLGDDWSVDFAHARRAAWPPDEARMQTRLRLVW
jgi:hypothetical protein